MTSPHIYRDLISSFIEYPAVFVGVVLVLTCIARWVALRETRETSEQALVVAIFTILIGGSAQAIATSMSRLRPFKYDLYAYKLDSIFGQPSFVLGRFVQHHFWLECVLQVAYGVLPNVVAAVLIFQLFRSLPNVRFVVYSFGLNLLAAPLLYLLIPICGPQFAFSSFPADPGPVTAHLIALSAAPNAMPSVHTSTALLIVFFSRRWRAALVASIFYLGLIVLSTLASGQHYFIDLIAAVPYTAIILQIARTMHDSWAARLISTKSSNISPKHPPAPAS